MTKGTIDSLFRNRGRSVARLISSMTMPTTSLSVSSSYVPLFCPSHLLGIPILFPTVEEVD